MGSVVLAVVLSLLVLGHAASNATNTVTYEDVKEYLYPALCVLFGMGICVGGVLICLVVIWRSSRERLPRMLQGRSPKVVPQA